MNREDFTAQTKIVIRESIILAALLAALLCFYLAIYLWEKPETNAWFPIEPYIEMTRDHRTTWL